MLPEHELARISLNSAYQQVVKWITPCDCNMPMEAHKDNESDLGYCIPREFGFRYGMNVVRRKATPEPDRETVKRKMYELTELVIENLGGDMSRLFSGHFTPMDKRKIVHSLSFAGYRVCVGDFRNIIMVAKTVATQMSKNLYEWNIDEIDKPLLTRYASLNCFDYARFKQEIADLKEYPEINMETLCPTLMKIHNEAMEHDNTLADTDYPYLGRHLPFDKLKGERIRCYKILRIMDEILSTSAMALTNSEMSDAIKAKGRERGIEFEDDIPESTLKKYYTYLRDLINVEHLRGEKKRFSREVYISGRKGHLYRLYGDRVRLSAFAVDIDVCDAPILRSEINSLSEYMSGLSDRDTFKLRYPLLSTLGNMEESVVSFSAVNGVANEISGAALFTINYLPQQHASLKEYVANAMESFMMLETYFTTSRERWCVPVAIKDQGDKWALVARRCSSGEIEIVAPEDIVPGSARLSTCPYPHVFEIEETLRYIVGLSSLESSVPYDMRLRLTSAGKEDITGQLSLLRPLILPRDIRKVSDSIYRGPYSEEYLVTLRGYLNKDLWEEIFQLDAAGKLISLEPKEIAAGYEDYFRERQHTERVPFYERKASNRRLRKAPLSDSE